MINQIQNPMASGMSCSDTLIRWNNRIEHPRIIYPINRAISVTQTEYFGIFPPNITET